VSEPLNDDGDAWAEIPNGSAVTVGEGGIDVADFRPGKRAAVKSQRIVVPA
jgi:glutamine amidotransferase